MSSKHSEKIARLIMSVTVVFMLISGICLYYGSKYITAQLLQANENYACDLAMIVQNNFKITDRDVAYMKKLTFNEMEVDPLNIRLMNIGNDVSLNATTSNVYVLAPLSENEIKYTTDEKNAEFFGFPPGTKLDGVWLFNGKIENGRFVPAVREDIYRYTHLSKNQREAMENKLPYGEFSSDAWGQFITGYAPLYTQEENFVGLLGIDFAPDKYQSSAQKMIFTLLGAFLILTVSMSGLFLTFYFKYVKAKEGQLYFDFYSRMSHDLRTPMNGILGMAELSRDEKDMDVLRQNFKMVEESGNYMLELINDSLDIQKLDADKLKLNLQKCKLSDLVDHVCNMVKISAVKKQITFVFINHNVELKQYVLVDELRLKQILINILFNAIKFTPSEGKVSFEVEGSALAGQKEKLCFRIADTGIGMSKQFIEKNLFHPFAQEGRDNSYQYSGSGLGLAIVHKLVDMMDGHIDVSSQMSKGSVFTVTLELPVVNAAMEPNIVASKNMEHQCLKNKKFLLCEDHPLNIEIMKRLLQKVGANVTIAHNGQEGIAAFTASAEGFYDLILMDIRMPVVDGLEATRTIRGLKRKDSTSIPIIAVTANAYDEDIRKALEAGVDDYLTKPVKPELMYTVLEQYVCKS